jgi:predicted nucleic acid-binding protein
MRIFLDTNVLLDVSLRRAGAAASRKVIAACADPWNEGLVAVHTLSNAFYVVESQLTRQEAWDFIGDVMTWATVAGISTADIHRTRTLGMKDFEDAMQIVAAEGCGADLIVTRNTKDFRGRTALPVVLPEDFCDQPPVP